MKLNKKGFTLIELLATVVIVGIVVIFSTYGIMQVLENVKENKTNISQSSIKEAARTYSSESNSSSWKTTGTGDYQLLCITVGELINKGFLSQDETFGTDITKETYVIVKRNKITLVVDNVEITNDNSSCT